MNRRVIYQIDDQVLHAVRAANRTVSPKEVLLSPEESGLEVKSIVKAHQIPTISRHRTKRRPRRPVAW